MELKVSLTPPYVPSLTLLYTTTTGAGDEMIATEPNVVYGIRGKDIVPHILLLTTCAHVIGTESDDIITARNVVYGVRES